MEVAWSQAVHGLQPDARDVLLLCGALDVPSISLTCVTAALTASPERAAEVVAALGEAAWGDVVDAGFAVATPARAFLRTLVAAESNDTTRVLDRMASGITRSPEVFTRTAAARADVLAVLHAARTHGRLDLVARIAPVVWEVARPEEVGLPWCRQLAAAGEDAAIAGKDPELFIELLDLSATCYSAAEDWPGVERARLRALAVVDDLGDSERFVRYLDALATNYRNWGRPHRTADMQLEIVTVRERGDDAAKTAEAFAAVGNTMCDAGQFDAAVHYLTQADRLLQGQPDDDPAALTRHALILGDLGRAHAGAGAVNNARTCFHQALGKVFDVPGDVADRIRELQEMLPPATQ